MKTLLVWILSITTISALGQSIKVKGRVTDNSNLALGGANVYLIGTYDGASTDSSGNFAFLTAKKGSYKLAISFLGYNGFQQEILLPDSNKYFKIQLVQISNSVNEVSITAGTYQAGDRKRGIQLTALDVLTTASSNGDFIGALNTLPGTQSVGDDGGLFVRGGDRFETKTYIDGLLVANPYTAKAPDLPTRGRFSPMLFSGTLFSTGGYSAEYGQALSAALILKTNNLISNNPQSISIMPFGFGAVLGKTIDSTAFSLNLNYYNLWPYYKVVPQSVNWVKCPESKTADFISTSKLGKKTYLKIFSAASLNTSALELPPQIDPFGSRYFGMLNHDYYFNAIVTSRIKTIDSKTGISYSYDKQDIDFRKANLENESSMLQIKEVLQFSIFKNITFKTGAETYIQKYRQKFSEPDSLIDSNLPFTNILTAVFGEGESKIGENISLRIGVRGEYASLNKESTLSPRISMAYKTGAKSQISAAFGYFNQLPKDEFIQYNNNLSSQQAKHYIVNYQYQTEGYLFRVEGYYKDYNKLTRVLNADVYSPGNFNSDGYGYARGLDIFWRDQKTIPNADYWISFTLLDAKKKYENYPGLMYPTYFSRYNASAVFKKYIDLLKTQVAVTYQFTSGRPYLDPYNEEHFTKDFQDLSVGFSYLTRLFDKFTIVHFSVTNILGLDQVYGYHYYKVSNGGIDSYEKIPIRPAAKRFFVLAIFITLNNKF
jgi:vitamin B12 transporter